MNSAAHSTGAESMNTFHVPTRPYSPIDAINRKAAATGSPGYAMKAAYADYNGYRVTVAWNDYSQHYVAQYRWAEWVYLARGSFKSCLSAALTEHNRGALGSSVTVQLREGDSEAADLCQACPALRSGELDRDPEWLTWRHTVAAQSVRSHSYPGRSFVRFDWELMQAVDSEAAYRAALTVKHGSDSH